MNALNLRNTQEIELYKMLKEICAEKRTWIIRRLKRFLVCCVRSKTLNGKKVTIENKVVE